MSTDAGFGLRGHEEGREEMGKRWVAGLLTSHREVMMRPPSVTDVLVICMHVSLRDVRGQHDAVWREGGWDGDLQ